MSLQGATTKLQNQLEHIQGKTRRKSHAAQTLHLLTKTSSLLVSQVLKQ